MVSHDKTLSSLIKQREIIERKLAVISKDLDNAYRENDSGGTVLMAKIEALQSEEKNATEDWIFCNKTITSFSPKNFSDFIQKALILINDIEAGYDDPILIKTLKENIRKLSLEVDNFDIETRNILTKFRRKKMLLIDDNQLDRMLIKSAILDANFDIDCLELSHGQNAVDTIKSKKPSVTLLDIRMPHVDGFEVLRSIRNDSKISDHPVWMLTGSDNPEDRRMAVEIGANGYYLKPSSTTGYDVLAANILTEVNI